MLLDRLGKCCHFIYDPICFGYLVQNLVPLEVQDVLRDRQSKLEIMKTVPFQTEILPLSFVRREAEDQSAGWRGVLLCILVCIELNMICEFSDFI